MPNLNELMDVAVLRELGHRVEAHRLERNLTQVDLGDIAGVGRSTVQKLEHGGTVQTISLVKILRALDLLDELDAAIPERIELPVTQLDRLRRPRRQRARHSTRGKEAQPPPGTPWTWGDES
jgi:transcriptional regulator with XRE-family HTH domain